MRKIYDQEQYHLVSMKICPGYRVLILVVLSLFWLLLLSGSAAGSVPEGSDDQDAAVVHPAVESYAREFSVSLSDAKRYLDRIWPVKEILGSIMELEESRVAGLGIDHGAGFMAWVWLTGDDPPGVEAARVADAHGDVQIRTGARYTYTQLRAAQAALDFDVIVESASDRVEAARVSDMVVYTDVDVRSNSVEVGIDSDLVSAHRTRRGAPDPLSDEDLTVITDHFADTIKDHVSVDVQVTVGPGAEPSADLIAGQPMRTCTAGFAAKENNGGPYGIITAGHCNNYQTMHGRALEYVRGWESPRADAQFHSIPQGSPDKLTNYYLYRPAGPQHPPIYSVTDDIFELTIRRMVSIAAASRGWELLIDNYVCHTGRITGVSCGNIKSVLYSFDGTNYDSIDYDYCLESDEGRAVNCLPVFFRVHGDDLKGCGGDSGGPWYDQAGAAYGITMAMTKKPKNIDYETWCKTRGKNAYFSSLVEVEKFLDVEVLTEAPSAPSPPGNVRSVVGPRAVSVVWDEPSEGATSYVVYRRVARPGEKYRVVEKTTATSHRVFYSELDPGSRYFYQVRAVNNLNMESEWGQGNYASIKVPGRVKVPGAPGNLRVLLVPRHVSVTWSAPVGGAEQYVVTRRMAKDGHDYERVITTSNTFYNDPVSGLNTNVEYYYRVYAVNASGVWGPRSNTSSEIIIRSKTQDPVPGAPGNLTVSLVPRYVRVAWSAPVGGAEKYVVTRRMAKAGHDYERVITTSNTYYYDPVSGLTTNVEYYYRVYAVNASGVWGPRSNTSSEIIIRTKT